MIAWFDDLDILLEIEFTGFEELAVFLRVDII